MSALIFLFSVAVIFSAVLAIEARDADSKLPRRPLGLIGWLTGGNWPAKVGGGLLVVGIGALLRFALINLDFPPSVKLATGVCAAGILGLAATLTRIGSARRAVSLALGGAAFGVAYLTAYSAFALFHYCDSPTGIGLLVLTAVGAGVYAITRGALSLALLAMVGAYLAPAFAIGNPGPATVYGYFAGASLLTLIMVAARGWRPLIHLSFLFSLGGGVFFAWTAKYYNPEHADVMLPALIVLTTLHVLMPIAERRGRGGVWIERLDLVYLLALPVVAGLSALLIAPSHVSLSNELLALSAVWFAVAAYLALMRRDGAVVHAVIGILLAGSAVAARFRDLPWELIALAFTVLALRLAARRSNSARLQSALAGLVPLAGFFHILSSLSSAPAGAVFVNELFLERLIGAGLLMFAGHVCRSIRQSLDTLLWSVGIGWAVIAVGAELLRWDLVSLAVVVHLAFLAAAAFLAVSKSTHRSIPDALVVVVLGVLFSAAWAAVHAPASVSWVSLVAAPLILSWLSIRRAGVEPQTRVGRTLAAMTAPVVAGLWALHAGALAGIHAPQFACCAVVLAALCLVVLGDLAASRCRDWRATAVHLYAYLFALPLAVATTIAIGRSPWAIALELLCLFGLLLLVAREQINAPLPRWVAPACALGAGLVIQTNLLRWFGPPGDLNIADLAHMRFTALVSFVWATLGAVMTLWGRKRVSRPLWIAGAALMVAAAAKFVLVDFGALGQLANILAVIAAGVVFLLVGWLAPMPPAVLPPPTRSDDERLSPNTSGPTHSGLKPTPSAAAALHVGQPRPNYSGGGTTPAAAASAAPSPADPVNEYWERNASRTPPAPSANWHYDRGDRIIWTVVILAIVVLPLGQCGRASHYFGRRNLGGQPIAATPSIATPVPRQAVAPVQTPAPSSAVQQPLPVNPTGHPSDDLAIGAPTTAVPQKAAECDRWAAALPADYVVYSAGAYQAPPLNPNSPAASPFGKFNVTVNAPGRNVVLLLGAYKSAAWDIRWGSTTRIIGVWISGYEPQFVAQLSANRPVLNTSFADRDQCPWFAVASGGAPDGSRAALQVMRHGVDATFPASGGQIDIGTAQTQMNEVQNNIAAISSAKVEIRSAVYASPRNGRAFDVTSQLNSQCSAAPGSCVVNCGNQLAGDPDFGQRKYCKILYQCADRTTQELRIEEGERATLRCQ
jgi:uncharacterized membrane protein